MSVSCQYKLKKNMNISAHNSMKIKSSESKPNIRANQIYIKSLIQAYILLNVSAYKAFISITNNNKQIVKRVNGAERNQITNN